MLAQENKKANNKLFTEIAKDGSFADAKIKENNNLIQEYQQQRDELLTNAGSQNDAVEGVGESFGIPKPIREPAQTAQPDFFTPITVEVSSSSDTKRSETTATSFSAGGSASWGLASVSASVSHSEAHSKAMSELTSSDVKISFECMRVDIYRPWLRPELFYDEELKPGPGVKYVSLTVLCGCDSLLI